MFSLVLPAYNEEKRIGNSFEKLLVFHSQNKGLIEEIILVIADMGDRTAEISKEYIGKLPNLKIITIKHNGGNSKGLQVCKGVMSAKSEWIAIMDSDLDYSVDNLLNTKKIIESNNLVKLIVGQRNTNKTHRGIRKHISRWSRILINIIANTGASDPQAGYKILHQDIKNLLFHNQIIIGWAYDVEMLRKAKLKKINTVEQDLIEFKIDQDGSNIKLKNIFVISVNFLQDLWTIRKNVRIPK